MLDWLPVVLTALLPVLGLLMVSRLRYVHPVSYLSDARTPFFTLVGLVFLVFFFYLAPVPILFLTFVGFTTLGLLLPLWKREPLLSRGSVPIE